MGYSLYKHIRFTVQQLRVQAIPLKKTEHEVASPVKDIPQAD